MREYVFWGLVFASFPLIIKNPFWGIVIYSGLNIIRPEFFFWGGRSNNSAAYYVFMVTVASTLFKGKFRISQSRYYLFLLFWVYVALKVSIYFSDYTIARANYYADESIKVFLLCFFLAALVDDEKKVKTIETAFLFCMTLLGIWAFDQHFRGNERLEDIGNMDSNGLASLFVTFLPLAYHKFFTSTQKKQKYFGALAILAILLTIVFTQSRGGFLGLVAATLFWYKSFKEKKRVFAYFALSLLFILPLAGQQYFTRLETMTADEETGSLEGSAYSRIILWKAGLMVFRDNMWFGTGFMSYPYAKMHYKNAFGYLDHDFREDVFRTKQPKVTHSTYIQVLADGGLFLALPYFLILLSTFWRNRSIRKRVVLVDENNDSLQLLAAIEAGIVGYGVTVVFLNSITFVFLPVQVVISAIIRKQLEDQISLRERETMALGRA